MPRSSIWPAGMLRGNPDLRHFISISKDFVIQVILVLPKKVFKAEVRLHAVDKLITYAGCESLHLFLLV